MENIIAASYNLHGIQHNDLYRFRRIAEELCRCGVDICGFQETVKSREIEDTSYQIARHMTRIRQREHYTWWQYCHMFFDRYPEGVSILSVSPFEGVFALDLDVTVRKNVKPLMRRFALFALTNIRGVRILFVTTHLDHHKAPGIRTAQAQKITDAVRENFSSRDLDQIVITGDLNAGERSACLKQFRREGFTDCYRRLHRTGGDTFPASGPCCRIDYILSKGKMKPIRAGGIFSGDMESLSDHIGLTAELQAGRQNARRKGKDR